MNKDATIIVTGAAGFIASCLVSYLNENKFTNLILVDQFDEEEKELNLLHKQYLVRVERDNFFEWLEEEKPVIDFVFHLGARTDTTEFDYEVHYKLNVLFTQQIWHYCTTNKVPLVYASSAATYGDGSLGYEDDHALVPRLKPLNPYGLSKNNVDSWILEQAAKPPFWAGLKFFNVYGPNEYHKARMASVVFHAYNQVRDHDLVKLFRSHKEGYRDGEQLRDFIYVKDVIKVCYWMMEHFSTVPSGLYNLGTGKSRTFIDLVKSAYKAIDKPAVIQFMDMPQDLRETYQYFTEARMQKLWNAGYREPFYSLEEGVYDYVKHYLIPRRYY